MSRWLTSPKGRAATFIFHCASFGGRLLKDNAGHCSVAARSLGEAKDHVVPSQRRSAGPGVILQNLSWQALHPVDRPATVAGRTNVGGPLCRPSEQSAGD